MREKSPAEFVRENISSIEARWPPISGGMVRKNLIALCRQAERATLSEEEIETVRGWLSFDIGSPINHILRRLLPEKPEHRILVVDVNDGGARLDCSCGTILIAGDLHEVIVKSAAHIGITPNETP
jgi:hypothetical protein